MYPADKLETYEDPILQQVKEAGHSGSRDQEKKKSSNIYIYICE